MKIKLASGQSLVEYVLIGATVALVLILSTKAISVGMKKQVEGTKAGFSSESLYKPR